MVYPLAASAFAVVFERTLCGRAVGRGTSSAFFGVQARIAKSTESDTAAALSSNKPLVVVSKSQCDDLILAVRTSGAKPAACMARISLLVRRCSGAGASSATRL